MMPATEIEPAYRLRDLLADVTDLDPRLDRAVSGVSADSRELVSGELFLARPGQRTDARSFIDAAIGQGAAAVVFESPQAASELRGGVPVVGVPGLSRRMGTIAARFFAHPSRAMWVAGVTGTNGKTSVSHFIAQALDEHPSGAPCGLLGTLGYGIYGALTPGLHTTPDVIATHRLLAGLRDRGVRRAVMEASSHGLDQGRVSEVGFDVAVFTNLSRDHLDYHPDMAAYTEAKRTLFQTPGLRHAVVNMDDPASAHIVDGLGAGVELLGYSLNGDNRRARILARRVETTPRGLLLELETPVGGGRLESALVGRFNGVNLLAALGVLLTTGMPLPEALGRLSRTRSVPGRMERFVGGAHQPLVVVDYAHTPDALGQVLGTLREHCAGRLWCVFGCGGERDAGKRAQMGAVAEACADRVVLTDDNPRGEDGDRIIRDILAGMKAPTGAEVERRRGAAITGTVEAAGADDVVLVAGKGHEDYQEVAGVRRPFSDRGVVGTLLAPHQGGRG